MLGDAGLFDATFSYIIKYGAKPASQSGCGQSGQQGTYHLAKKNENSL